MTKATLKTKSAMSRIKKVRKGKIKSWTMEDMLKMKEIIEGAQNRAAGERKAAKYFGVSDASIQCRWSRYMTGKALNKFPNIKDIGPVVEKEPMKRVPFVADVSLLDKVLAGITIKDVQLLSKERKIIINY